MIYNEAKWLRALILVIPHVGSSIDMLLYKKGNDTEKFRAGEDLKDGDNCYLNTKDGKFYKASAKSCETSSTMLVKALQKIKAHEKGVFLVRGKYYTKNLKTGTLFLGTEKGELTSKMPEISGSIIRIISTALSEKEEYFCPSHDYIERK